jgi:gamma-glutamyltranspeptidase/glutathione hydrolase
VPRRFPPERLRVPGATDPQLMVQGGAAVAPPAVVPGLLEAHARFGRLPLGDVLAPAIRLARDGFVVGRDLARELGRHREDFGEGTGDDGIRARFFPGGDPLRVGEQLVQADLAVTLGAVAREGADALCRGQIGEAICAAVTDTGGWLDLEDLERSPLVREAEGVEVGAATVYAPTREVSGAGVILGALEGLDAERLGPNRSRAYVEEVASALAKAWRVRLDAASAGAASSHTTTLASADADGALVAVTFTHGPTLGSGILVPGTGVVLNGGANLFAPSSAGGRAVTNMSPLIVEHEAVRHGLGGTGGPRIPAMLTTAVIDLVHYGFGLLEAIAAPHISVRAADGRLEIEEALSPLFGPDEAQVLVSGDFGPSCGVTVEGDTIIGASDPRFERGLARV